MEVVVVTEHTRLPQRIQAVNDACGSNLSIFETNVPHAKTGTSQLRAADVYINDY